MIQWLTFKATVSDQRGEDYEADVTLQVDGDAVTVCNVNPTKEEREKRRESAWNR